MPKNVEKKAENKAFNNQSLNESFIKEEKQMNVVADEKFSDDVKPAEKKTGGTTDDSASNQNINFRRDGGRK